jgi:hypothetical protein
MPKTGTSAALGKTLGQTCPQRLTIDRLALALTPDARDRVRASFT